MTENHLPAEWEQQSGLMLTWPHPDTDWRSILDEVEAVFTSITRQTCPYQAVLISCCDAGHKLHVQELLRNAGVDMAGCRFYIATSNDSWVRDHGPLTVIIDNAPVLLDFTFNGWGNKYSSDLDNHINRTLQCAGAFDNCPMHTLDFVLEGGSLETDGQGTLLTTTSCLLSSRRNGGYSQADIEAFLKNRLYLKRVIWIQHGHLQGDDTDGHIDTLVRFADPQTLLYVEAPAAENPNHASLEKMRQELQVLQQGDGRPYKLVALPCPVINNEKGQLLPASYANFVIINEAVLVPQYGVDDDDNVMDIFRNCFPDRTIIAIDCRPLIRQFGSLHCVTMNLPQGVLK
ncbi:MAG TPA: agmatine deiminase family protein [Gammaproteobacteria bacterium]|nr:agmatine deiminase family protein [Gammaproteobacteria bacterium]